MQKFAEAEEFELAMEYRDKLAMLSKLKLKRITSLNRALNADIIALKTNFLYSAVNNFTPADTIDFFESHGSPYLSNITFVLQNILFLGLFIGMLALKEGRSIAIVGGVGVLVGFAINVLNVLRNLQVAKIEEILDYH